MRDVVIHSGVKGMKWGVVKKKPLSAQVDGGGSKNDFTARQAAARDQYYIWAGRREILKKGTTRDRIPIDIGDLRTEKEHRERNGLPINTPRTDGKTNDFERESEIMAKPVSKMSNAELRVANERLQLTRTYASLTAKDISPAKKFVVDVIQNAGKKVATEYVAKYMTTGMEALMKKAAK